MAMFGAMFGGRRRMNPISLVALVILAPIAAMVMQLAVSRSREYQADWSGAELIGTGEPLARALRKIEAAAQRIPMNIDPAHATAYIVNPLTGRNVSFASLFSTHPPTDQRIARLIAYRPQTQA
jgi:heat shock protein HtpX